MPAPTKTAICNMALTLINARPITSIDSDTREARICRTFYEQIRKSVLADFDWNFARREVELAAVSADDYNGWTYAYSYPADCVPGGFLRIYRESPTGEKIKFEIRSNNALTKSIILTEEDDAIGVYTADVEITGRFTPKFIDAFVLKLASVLAPPLKAKQSVVAGLLQQYNVQIIHAKALSANEQEPRDEDHNGFVAARS